MITHSELPPVPVADHIDRFILASGRIFSWSYAALIAVIILQVTLRYGFSKGMVMLEELQWHLYAIAVMFGISYAQVLDAHIRVDLLHMRMRSNTKRIWEILGILFLLMPFIAVVFIHSIDFVVDSWRINERSDAPTGLPWRWAIKAVIPLSFGYLFLAACSRLIREVTYLIKGVH